MRAYKFLDEMLAVLGPLCLCSLDTLTALMPRSTEGVAHVLMRNGDVLVDGGIRNLLLFPLLLELHAALTHALLCGESKLPALLTGIALLACRCLVQLHRLESSVRSEAHWQTSTSRSGRVTGSAMNPGCSVALKSVGLAVIHLLRSLRGAAACRLVIVSVVRRIACSAAVHRCALLGWARNF